VFANWRSNPGKESTTRLKICHELCSAVAFEVTFNFFSHLAILFIGQKIRCTKAFSIKCFVLKRNSTAAQLCVFTINNFKMFFYQSILKDASLILMYTVLESVSNVLSSFGGQLQVSNQNQERRILCKIFHFGLSFVFLYMPCKIKEYRYPEDTQF